MALDRTGIVTASLELLDEVGLEALTLRRLAEKLEVKAPAIYWHFKNKQDLLDEMGTVVLRSISEHLTQKKGLRWNGWVRFYASSLRQTLLGYRDGARMVSGTKLTDPSLYNDMETALKRFTDAGFSPTLATIALSTIYSYVIGFVIEEQAIVTKDGQIADPYVLENRARRIDSNKTPLTLKAGKILFIKLDHRFDAGLMLIIDGIEASKIRRRSKD